MGRNEKPKSRSTLTLQPHSHFNHTHTSTTLTLQPHPHFLTHPHPNPLVELAGIEPASKQGTNKLSTCLFDFGFSNPGCQPTGYLDLSSLISLACQSLRPTSPELLAPQNQNGSGQNLLRDVSSQLLEPGSSVSTKLRLRSDSVVIFAN